MKKNISQINNCFGCGVCSAICPIRIISMEINTDGFFQPVISNNNKCVECGRCLNVCPLNSKDKEKGKRENSYNGYASWSRDLSVRHKSSSGGTGFEVARYLLNKGYKIIGVRYNAVKERAEHYVATRESELIPSMGSKYIQSYTDDAFPIIKKQELHAKLQVYVVLSEVDAWRMM